MDTGAADRQSPGMWQEDFLLEFEKIDQEQPTHGLYGLRHFLGKDRALSFVQTYAGRLSPATHVPQRLGWKSQTHGFDEISMTLPGGQPVRLTMTDYASTKVRQYGNTHVLDRTHGKKDEEDPGVVESLVSKLAKLRKLVPVRSDEELPVSGYFAVMMIAHVPAERRLPKLLGRMGSEEYLSRYQLGFTARQWQDRYERGFFTALWLWTLAVRGK